MTVEEWIVVAVPALLGLSAVVGIVGGLRMRRKLKSNEPNEDAPPEGENDGELYPEAKTEELHVTVEDQSCSVKMIGTKDPRTVREFFICFRNDDGGLFTLPVPEEMYDGFEKGQRGILTLVDGEIYGFVPDEQ